LAVIWACLKGLDSAPTSAACRSPVAYSSSSARKGWFDALLREEKYSMGTPKKR